MNACSTRFQWLSGSLLVTDKGLDRMNVGLSGINNTNTFT